MNLKHAFLAAIGLIFCTFSFKTSAQSGGAFVFSPSPATFSNTLIGTQSAAQTIAVTFANNRAPDQTQGITYAISFTGPYSAVTGANDCLVNSTYPPCNIYLVFSPQAPGQANGSMTLSANNGFYPATVLPLSGSGFAPPSGPVPTLSDYATIALLILVFGLGVLGLRKFW